MKPEIAYLLSSAAIRDRCQHLFNLCSRGQLQHFVCDLTQLERVANYVIATMKERYPDHRIPFHSRWRHFEAGGISRIRQLDEALSGMTVLEKARAKVDLAVVSVLLDAGAGSAWRYRESLSGEVFARSEGLAVASFHLFMQGAFSSAAKQSLQVDAEGLQQLNAAKLEEGFQVGFNNPLVGIAGRLSLLHRLGQTLASQPQRFGSSPARPGYLIDYLKQQYSEKIDAADLLSEVLGSFSRIWPGRVELAGVNLGDVWAYQPLAGEEPSVYLVPFHKLSQWLTYSLVEPLTEASLEVSDLDGLTGLAEYRNGGLCLDLGLLQPKQLSILGKAYPPESAIIVEWRALTVILLDKIAEQIRQQLGRSAVELPLIAILEGGTWSAGRRIAQQLRPTGEPPILLSSDGTVF